MGTFRPAPGMPCPSCSYPHFPFCVRHPSNVPSLPSLMAPSFPFATPPRGPVTHPPMHPGHPPPHPTSLIPPHLPGYQSAAFVEQPFSGRGTTSDLLADRGSNQMKSSMGHRFPQPGRPVEGTGLPDSIPRHNQTGESCQNPLPHPLVPRPAHLIHTPQSMEHFSPPLNSTAPVSAYPASLARVNGSSNGWSEEDEREKLIEKAPSMPQWFLDQQRRTGVKGVSPNGRSGIGEMMLRGEEAVPGPYFGSEVPVPPSRATNLERVERSREEGFVNGGVQEAQRPACWFRDDMPPTFADREEASKLGAFHRADVSSNGSRGSQDGTPRADAGNVEGFQQGPQGSREHFEGGNEGGIDRERRIWDAPSNSSMEQGFASHQSGYSWTSSSSEQRQASAIAGGGGEGDAFAHHVGRGDWAEEGRRLQPSASSSSREEQLLVEHGLVVNGSQDLMRSGSASEERWDGRGLVPARPQFSTDAQDEAVQPGDMHQRRLPTHGENGNTAIRVQADSMYLARQQVSSDTAGNFLHSERSQLNVERPSIERSMTGGEHGLPHSGLPQHSQQSTHISLRLPAQEQLGEMHYLKHFNQPDDRQVRDGPAMFQTRLQVPASQVGIREDGQLFQEASSHMGSQTWTGEQWPAVGNSPGDGQFPDRGLYQSSQQVKSQGSVQFPSHSHIQQHYHALQQNPHAHHGYPQEPAVSHQMGRSSPLSHGPQQSSLNLQAHLQGHVQLPPQNHPQPIQSGPLHIRNQQSDQTQPGLLPNGRQAVPPTHPTQVQRQQHQHHQAAQPNQALSPPIPNQYTQPLPQSQSPFEHQMQNQGNSSLSTLPRFYPGAQGMNHNFANGGSSLIARATDPKTGNLQAPVPPSIVHHHPFPSSDPPQQAYHPPLPLTAAAAPPPPPPSPPHGHPPPHPPPHSPPLAPPPPPSSPPPAHAPGSSHAPTVRLPGTLPGQLGDFEELSHGLNFPNQPLAFQQPLLAIQSQGPGFQSMGPPYMHQAPFGDFRNHGQVFPQQLAQQQEKPKVVDAVSIFRRPGRSTRPERIVVILRGLPGSGKSYLAKALRDVELMNGGTAPRIHSMDDYFMTEVEKVEGEGGCATPSSGMRSKKRVMKKVMEYCFEPEMEEVYRASMLKAFRKTLEEGMFSFVMVDDRNVLVADFAQFWAVAKRSGYEVYLLEPPYRDPRGCAARNVHNFTQEQIEDMAKRWEPTPPLYLQLDISSLFRGDDLNAQDITEVEMDTDDMERETDEQEEGFQPTGDHVFKQEYSIENGKKAAIAGDRWEKNDAEIGEGRVKPAKRMRTSEDVKSNSDSSDSSPGQGAGNDALSGLMQAYGRREKSVHWADHQDEKDDEEGFSIGSALEKICDLVIGPGPGYNKVSNPVQKEEDELYTEHEHPNQSGKFLEQYRAEQDAFKAVFASRRQRLAGLDEEDKGN